MINIYDRPVLTVAADTVCLGLKTTLKGSMHWGNAIGGNWNWNTGDGFSYPDTVVFHAYKTPGIFRATCNATNSAGCRDSAGINIWVYPKPEAAFTIDPDPVVAGSDAALRNSSKGAANWEWMMENKLISMDKDPVLKAPAGGRYKLTLVAINNDNCRDTAEQILLVTEKIFIHIPNSFTPDGNFRDEVFRVYGLEKKVDRYYLRIYSRWGEKLFETADPEQGWDGRYGPDGKPCQEGQYIYLMHSIDIFGNAYNHSGTVLLLR